MAKINLTGINNSSKGMPDCWFLDSTGKSNPEVFQKHFGMPRNYRSDKKPIEQAHNRSNRLLHFLMATLHYRHLGQPILLSGDKHVSPEAHALARYDEGWHLRGEDDFSEVSKLDAEDIKAKLKDLQVLRSGKDYKPYQVKIQALANRGNTTIDFAYETMCKCAIESWLRARSQLANWSSFNAADKELLAEVIFSGFTFFGKQALEEIASIEPEIFGYYLTFRGLPLKPVTQTLAKSEQFITTEKPSDKTNQKSKISTTNSDSPKSSSKKKQNNQKLNLELDSNQKATQKIESETSTDFGENELPTKLHPESLKELYRFIEAISKEAANQISMPGAKPGKLIKNLLDLHLQRLEDFESDISVEEVKTLVENFCNLLLSSASDLEYESSSQENIIQVLRAAWRATLFDALRAGLQGDWFESILGQRLQMFELVERFKKEKFKIDSANDEINEIRKQLSQAKFTARASLKAKESHKNNEINSALHEIELIRVEAANLLLPEGRTLDDLMEDESLLIENNIQLEKFNHQSVLELRLILTTQGAEEFKDDIDTGGSLFDEPKQGNSDIDKASAKRAELAINLDSNPKETFSTATVDQALENASEVQIDFENPDVDVSEHPSAFKEDLEGEVLADKAQPCGIDEALKHLHWSESKEEAQQAFRISYDQYSQVPHYVVEAAALHWMEQGHLNVAALMLRDANESTLISEQIIDSTLLRSAFYGMNMWPKDRDALSNIQRHLNLLNQKDLEFQLDRKPSGKVVPYLLVCATLQTALFAGSETQAPTLLKIASDHFDDHLSRLLLLTAEFTLRGGHMDLEGLRNEHVQEVHLAAAKLKDQVNTWVDLNQHRTNRWHALRLALRSCIKYPVLSNAIDAIRLGEKGDSGAVRFFVNSYSSHLESRQLLDDLVAEVRSEATFNEQIDSQAYSIFCQQIDALISIGQAWLLEVVPSELQQKDIKDFLEKFHTLLDRSIHNLESQHGLSDLEHRSGSALLLKMLCKLQAEIKKPSHRTWQFNQTDATFHLPERLARLDMRDVGVDLRLEWLAMRLASPNWFSDMLSIAKNHKAHWIRLLLLYQMEELNWPNEIVIDIGSAIADIATVRAELKNAIEEFRNLSLQAMSVDILSESDHLSNVSMLNDWLKELSDRKPYIDLSDIGDEVKLRISSMEKLLNSSAAQLEEELNRELLNIRVKVGNDAVPDGWDNRARQALTKRNLSLVRELINQLKEHIDRNSRLIETSLIENVELMGFLKVEDALCKLLNDHPNPREAGDRLINDRIGGLDYDLHKAEFKDVIAILLEWRKGKNKKPNLEKPTYENIVAVLGFIGLDVVQKIGKPDVIKGCEYSPTGDFRRLKVRLNRPSLPKGFPLFEGEAGSSQPQNVILVQGGWSLSGLTDLIEQHGQPDREILMVGHPLSLEERRNFAVLCRERKCTIFLLDPVTLAYIATARNHQLILETFLRISANWTFYNPYTKGDARLPAPPEMRFGRERDIVSLVEPRGAALVYGGRQLGKTTLLNAAVQEFKKRDPLHNYAYYIRMDGIFQYAVERSFAVKKRLFELLVRKLVDENVLGNNPSSAQLDPEDRLRQEFLRPGTTKVLFCLDEIDSILDKDAANNFELVRALVGLVNDQHSRFRVVFAGLNNVNRFRTYPNVPLEQLGSSLPVGILTSKDARSLILQPLTALGYTFEESELVDRVMAFTNRHPRLLHIFCSELVEQLGWDRSAQEDLRLIRQTDIENIENNSDVRRLSGERFDMTLNLDKRYTVAVYGLIDAYGKALGQFSVGKALEVARTCVPEEFEQMSESGFESILVELVGLGVLVEDKTKRQYALRNQSILQFIGSMDDIRHKLQQAINGLKNHQQDVLTCHATGSIQNSIPSPLSLQDERMILSAKAPEGAPNYSVCLVMGTPALGLTMKSMQEGFYVINEFQSGSVLAKYETQLLNDAASIDLSRFSQRIDTAIENLAAAKPAVVLISLEDCQSIDRIMDLINIANEKASKAIKLKHPLRLVFVFGAKAMWTWYAHSWLTIAPNEIGGEVNLNRWTRQACQSLLEQQGMSDTPDQGDMLLSATEGWYSYLMIFIEARRKKITARSFNDFSKSFKSIEELPAKDFEKFIQSTGMITFNWSLSIAGKLKEFDMLNNFSKEDLQTAIEFIAEESADFPIYVEQTDSILRWWAALRVLEVNNKEKSKDADREGKITYSFIPSIQRAISEYLREVNGKELQE